MTDQEKLESLQAELAGLQTEFASVEQHRQALTEGHAEDLQRRNAEILQRTSAITEARSTLEALQVEVVAMESALTEQQSRIEALRVELEPSRERIAKLEHALADPGYASAIAQETMEG